MTLEATTNEQMIAYTDEWLFVCGDGQDGRSDVVPPTREIRLLRVEDGKIYGEIEGNIVEVKIQNLFKDDQKLTPIRPKHLKGVAR